MKQHRYILEPYKEGKNNRYTCPNCKQNRKFSLYIDTVTGEYVHPTVGRCNRESKCNNHYTPKQYFQDNNISFETPQYNQYTPQPIAIKEKPISFIPVKFLKASLKEYETNNFVKFLNSLFGSEITNQLIKKYFIASSKHWNGATVFWQIDSQGKIRTGKIILYNPTTGKRVKEPYSHISWVQSVLKLPDFVLKQCLFGQHLLIDKTKAVAIVESEKTAVIASVYLPQFIWLAVGSLTNLNAEKCSVLKGRNVTLFPDLNGFEKWNRKKNELSHIANFTISSLLERKATETERKQGLDIADYLIKHDHKEFAETEHPTPPPAVQTFVEVEQFEQPECWLQNISELENYFASIDIPTQPIKLNQHSTIKDCSQFIESHIATAKANNGKRTFLPYLDRLQELKQILTINLKQHESK